MRGCAAASPAKATQTRRMREVMRVIFFGTVIRMIRNSVHPNAPARLGTGDKPHAKFGPLGLLRAASVAA